MKRLGPVLLLAACPRHADKPVEPPQNDDAAPRTADAGASSSVVVVPPSPPVPAVPSGLPQPPPHDGITPDAVAFGALLFADPALSRTGKIACASCHDPAHGFSGGVDAFDDGTKAPSRTPALVNLAWMHGFGWDNVAVPLDRYLAGHLAVAMGNNVAPHTPLYAAYAATLGGDTPAVAALTAYVLTRYDGDSAWDRAERSPSPPPEAVAGYRLFTGKAQCAHCHAPPLYTDLGGHDHVRTPTLRGVAKRSRYLHDGSAATLEAAIAHEARDVALSPAEKTSLAAFLRAL